MRIVNLAGRAAHVVRDIDADGGGLAIDIADATDGRMPDDPMALLERFDELASEADRIRGGTVFPFAAADVLAPVPRPRQVFAVGLNYRTHSEEAGFAVPDEPMIFTKFPSCIVGPYATIALPPGQVDWELEVVAVIGRLTSGVPQAEAWGAVAGITVGQDLSERSLQLRGHPPQFSLAKSHAGFGPIGPAIVTVDELADADDLTMTATLSGERVQHARTSEMIFPIPDLVAYLSAVCVLMPGDLIFTGTPAGVGNRRHPQRFIAEGDVLVSHVEGIGSMRHRFIAQSHGARRDRRQPGSESAGIGSDGRSGQ